MFFVADSAEFKERKIRSYLDKEPMIAVLLAAANWEWTVSRCILFLSETPNVELHKKLGYCHGLEKYKDLWSEELSRTKNNVNRLPQLIKNWSSFNEAFTLRHLLVHGKDTCTKNMAIKSIDQMLIATKYLYEFAESHGINLNTRLKVRRRKTAILSK